MKMIIKASVLVLVIFLISSFKIETTVYICKTKSSKKYHFTKSCRGLSRCSIKIEEVGLSKAKRLGRTLCGWED